MPNCNLFSISHNEQGYACSPMAGDHIVEPNKMLLRATKLRIPKHWEQKKQAGLIVPLEVADSFITIDNHTANGVIRPLIERLECTKAGLS